MSQQWQRVAVLCSLAAYPVLSLHGASTRVYQCISMPTAAGARGAGGGAAAPAREARSSELKSFIVAIDSVGDMSNPGLVLLAEGLGAPGQGIVDINGNNYEIPPSAGGLLAKIVVPLKPAHLHAGINRVAFSAISILLPTRTISLRGRKMKSPNGHSGESSASIVPVWTCPTWTACSRCSRKGASTWSCSSKPLRK